MWLLALRAFASSPRSIPKTCAPRGRSMLVFATSSSLIRSTITTITSHCRTGPRRLVSSRARLLRNVTRPDRLDSYRHRVDNHLRRPRSRWSNGARTSTSTREWMGRRIFDQTLCSTSGSTRAGLPTRRSRSLNSGSALRFLFCAPAKVGRRSGLQCLP